MAKHNETDRHRSLRRRQKLMLRHFYGNVRERNPKMIGMRILPPVEMTISTKLVRGCNQIARLRSPSQI